MKSNIIKNALQGVGIALSIGAIATCGIAMADALRPKKAVAIEEYTLCYIMGTDTYKISSTGSIQLTAPIPQKRGTPLWDILAKLKGKEYNITMKLAKVCV